jgi:hypothetical protein
MSFLSSDTWAWLKTAPLPVVLSLCFTSFTLVGSYAYSIDKAQQEHVAAEKAVVAVAAEQAKVAAETARRVEDKIDKLANMLDQVILERAVAKAKREKKNE